MPDPNVKEPGITLAYLRVSTDKQDTARQKLMVERLRERGLTVEVFEDEDEKSVVLMQDRPGGRQALERVRQGGVYRFWVPEFDRIGRSLRVVSDAFYQIEKYPNKRPVIEVGMNFKRYTMETDEDSDLIMSALEAAKAHAERVRTRKRAAGGRAVAERDPYHWDGGPSPYSFNRVGSRKNATLAISDQPTTGHRRLRSRKAVMVEIYQRLASNASTRTVADFLNDSGIPAGNRQKGAAQRWTPGRIGNLARNPIHMGERYRHKHGVYIDPDDPRQKSQHVINPESKWEKVAVPTWAIVTPELWHAANDAMAARKSVSKAEGRKNKRTGQPNRTYLLTGLVTCDQCGRRFVGTTIHNDGYYRCRGRSAAYNADGIACRTPHLRADALDAAVWEDVEGLFRRPDQTLRRIDEQIVAEHGSDRNIADELADVRANRARFKDQWAELLRQHLRNPLDDETLDRLRSELDESDKRQQDRERELVRLDAERKVRDVGRDAVRSLLVKHRQKVLSGKLTPEEKRYYLRCCVKAVHVRMVEGKPEVTVEYNFASPYDRWDDGSADGGKAQNQPLAQNLNVMRSCRPRAW
jgi:site-specific DNA recombinase